MLLLAFFARCSKCASAAVRPRRRSRICLHPAEIVGRQPACCRAALHLHCDVEPIERVRRIPASTRIDRRPTAVGERGCASSANGPAQCSVGSAPRCRCWPSLLLRIPPDFRCCFDIADVHFQVTFALAAADERRIHADSDHCCRSCWLVRGCTSNCAPIRSVWLRNVSGPDRRQWAAGVARRSDAIVIRAERWACSWSSSGVDRQRDGQPTLVSMRLQAVHRNRGSGTVTAPNSVAMWCPRQSFRWHFLLQAEQHGRRSPYCRLARKRPLAERSPEAASLPARSNPGSQYRQDLPTADSARRCPGNGIIPVAITATPTASVLPVGHDPTDRNLASSYPVSGHSHPIRASGDRLGSRRPPAPVVCGHLVLCGSAAMAEPLVIDAPRQRTISRLFEDGVMNTKDDERPTHRLSIPFPKMAD